jgi:integrase
VSSLRFFFGVTLGRTELPERIAYARRPKTLPVILSPEEVAAFLEAVEGRRNRVALTTAYATGLRASEVVGLRNQDIDSSRMVIHVVNGKGGKQRYVMLSPKLLGILRAYWAIERCRSWLFPGRGGDKPLNPSILNAACAAAVEATGISKHATLHSLRHAFATHLLEQGVDISIIQALLGHSHLSTTMRYISVATRTIAAVKSPLEHLQLAVPEMRLQQEQRPPA